jgi:hypothetical protein
MKKGRFTSILLVIIITCVGDEHIQNTFLLNLGDGEPVGDLLFTGG